MKKNLNVLLLAAVVAASVFTGCSKDDDEADVTVRQSYTVKLTYAMPYDQFRYNAPDSLMEFINDRMGLEKDTIPNGWIVTGNSVEDCDSIISKKFEQACSYVDPEDYGGKYTVKVNREDADGKCVTLAEIDIVATAENSIFDLIEELRERLQAAYEEEKKDPSFIYDVAIASGDTYAYPHDCLTNNGYSVIEGDLNQNAGGKYIYVGYKSAKGNYVTDIDGEVEDEETGDIVKRKLTAKEAAISFLLCIQNSGHPTSFKGPINTTQQNYVFYQFRQLGDSDGNTNQGSGGDDSFLYYTRSGNSRQFVHNMFFVSEDFDWAWDEGSDRDDLIWQAKYDGSSRCSIESVRADLNADTWDDYTYIGYNLWDL